MGDSERDAPSSMVCSNVCVRVSQMEIYLLICTRFKTICKQPGHQRELVLKKRKSEQNDEK